MLEVLLFLCQYELLSWIFRIWIFMPQIRRFTLKLCQSITLHQKFFFYHLPTRGRAGIKLGDAWYVSNVSIIFDCSMLLYLLFWTILGFIFHFYITFGTNLLTGGLAQNCCFLPFLVFRRNRISNGVQTEWNLQDRDFPTERVPGDLDPTPSSARGGHEGGGRPPGRAPYLVGPSELHRRTPSSYIYLCIPERSKQEPKTYFQRRNFQYPRDPILGPVPELRRRGHPPWRASTSSP